MTFAAKCPGCGHEYHVNDDQVGRRAHCRCGQTFTLRMTLDETQPDRPAPEPPSGVAPPPHAPPPAAATPPEPAGPPRDFGPYVLLRLIGQGGMGEVWLAFDKNLNREVAVKFLPRELAADAEALQRFLREARVAARLNHRHAVTVYDAGVEAGRAYMVMQYLAGGSLARCAEEQLPWREAVRMVRDAARGLQAAHELGLVHRDVKPANLMRSLDGTIKVADFGLARAQVDDTQLSRAGVLLGTAAYMAPEQWIGGEADPRSDIYALTCTLYHLLTGRAPFSTESLAALGYCHRYEPPPDPRRFAPGLPDALCRILARGSAKEPAHRYANCTEMVVELEALLAADDAELTCALPWESFILALTTPALRPAAPAPSPAMPAIHPAASGPQRPAPRRSPWAQLSPQRSRPVGCAIGLALVGLLGIALFVATDQGTVQFVLVPPEARLEVQIDGKPIDPTRPQVLRTGNHQLTATSGGKEVSGVYPVVRGQQRWVIDFTGAAPQIRPSSR